MARLNADASPIRSNCTSVRSQAKAHLRDGYLLRDTAGTFCQKIKTKEAEVTGGGTEWKSDKTQTGFFDEIFVVYIDFEVNPMLNNLLAR